MKHIFLSTLALTLLAGTARTQQIKENSLAPTFTVQTLEGKTVRLSDLKGKVVLLDFGAVNCPPCRLEMPILEGWHKKYRSRGVGGCGADGDEPAAWRGQEDDPGARGDLSGRHRPEGEDRQAIRPGGASDHRSY